MVQSTSEETSLPSLFSLDKLFSRQLIRFSIYPDRVLSFLELQNETRALLFDTSRSCCAVFSLAAEGYIQNQFFHGFQEKCYETVLFRMCLGGGGEVCIFVGVSKPMATGGDAIFQVLKLTLSAFASQVIGHKFNLKGLICHGEDVRVRQSTIKHTLGIQN